jgi:predicted HTH transcriptional regulator
MALTAGYDPIVVEPDLTSVKVRELVTRGVESAKLDYKRLYDPSDAKSRMQLVRHVIAMANTAGGYIVIGVDDDGTPVGVDPLLIGRLDEATIRTQIAGFTSTSIPLFVNNRISFEDHALAIITVLPLDDRIAVIAADGQYSDAGRQTHAFRKGDVFVRHGSSSERWDQDDADSVLRRSARHQKQQWLQEFARDLHHVVRLAGGGSGPVIDDRVFELPPNEFQDIVLHLLRAENG